VSRPRVLVTELLGDTALRLLEEGDVEVEAYDLLPEQDFVPRLREADAVIIRSAHRIQAEHLDAAPNVRVVARAGTGVDNIDLEAATSRGVLVLNTSGANAQAAAEHTFGLLLALVRHIRTADAHVRAGGWDRAAFYGEELYGKTLGIIGIGRVGSRVARFGRAFGMRVLAYDPFVPAETVADRGAEKVDELEDLLAHADVLTIHTPKSGPRLGLREFSLLPKGAYVLNVARGGLYDEAALARLLEEGHLAGVALDVFASEPPPPDLPLLKRDDVLVTCHLGGSTAQAQEQIGVRIARAVLVALRGGIPDEAVNIPFPQTLEVRAADALIAAGDTLGRLAAGTGGGGEITLAAGHEEREALELYARSFLTGYLSLAGDGLRIHLQSELGDDPRRGLFSVRIGGGPITVQAVEDGLRLKALGGAAFDVLLAPDVLWTRHQDVPGVVGRVGTVLEARGVNIASLALSREAKGGEAVMVLTLDEPPSEDVLAAIRALPMVKAAGAVHLPLAAPKEAALHAG
jgi:D-3-phosphoglycerate dehydrogenase